MTGQDLPAFAEMFQDLATIFKLYGTEDQKASTLSAYFNTMQKYPLERVRQGYDNLKATAQKWPVPAQWIAAMPSGQGADLPLMSLTAARESDDAENRFYEGELCACSGCVAANVTHMPLRFVPCLDGNGEVIPMLHPRTQTRKLLGEWIHGHRLKRWYAARAEFYQKLESLKPRAIKAMPEAMSK